MRLQVQKDFMYKTWFFFSLREGVSQLLSLFTEENTFVKIEEIARGLAFSSDYLNGIYIVYIYFLLSYKTNVLIALQKRSFVVCKEVSALFAKFTLRERFP